jgi:hypothetical protein
MIKTFRKRRATRLTDKFAAFFGSQAAPNLAKGACDSPWRHNRIGRLGGIRHGAGLPFPDLSTLSTEHVPETTF